MPDVSQIHVRDSFLSTNPSAVALVHLFEVLPEVIFYVKDTESKFVAANTAMLEAKNIKNPDDLLGESDFAFHPRGLAEAYRAEDQDVMRSGQPLLNRVWFVLDPSSRPGWFISSKVPLQDHNGQVLGIAGVRYAIETPEERRFQFKTLAPVFQHLEEHYDKRVSMTHMAKLAGLSQTHFNRSFNDMVGMPPSRFLQHLRIEKARQLLTLTERNISTIAQDIGYHDQSHFSRHFRQITSTSPRDYRMRFRT